MIKIFTRIPKIILIFLFFLFTSISLASDEKPGRFFEDQPDVNDDYQIHFLYTLAKDGEDREWDINGKMEAMLLEMNEIMARETKKKSKGESKKYYFDYRKDGKLDITFLRLDKNFKDLDRKSSINNNISAFLWLKRLNNPKKIYFSFSDMGGRDGGEAGVTQGSTFLRHSSVGSKNNIIKVTLHELIHAQGGGFNCVPGVSNQHLTNWTKGYQLTKGHKLSSIYIHKVEGCPQLVDSVYLTPTSKDPYDPFKLICQNEWEKYNHKKLVKLREKQKKDLKNGKWNYRSGGSGCKFSYWDQQSGKMKIFNDQIAKSFYQGN